MKCHEFEDRLHRLLDDRQAPEADAPLVEHAAGCGPCGQMLAGQRLLLVGLRRGVTQRPGSQLAQNAVAGYRSEPIEERAEPMQAVVLDGYSAGRRAWQVLGWMAATAAAVAIAVTIYLASQPGRPQIAAVPPPAETVRPSVPREGNPRTAQRAPTLGAFQLLPRRGYGAAIADMATSSLPDAVERIEDVERFAPGIRPIRVSFAMLWDALWRTIPGHGSPEPDPNACYGGLESIRLA